jgi:fructuronate reductase
MDGSQKLPQRLLGTIAARLAAGQGIDALSLAVAAWIRWQAGVDDLGAPHEVDDPLAAQLAARLEGTQDAAARVAAILGLEAIVPAALSKHPVLVEALTGWLTILENDGARGALTRFRRVAG